MPGVRRDPAPGQGIRAVKVVVEADGGSRGNPGPAGYGAVVLSADRATVLAEAKRSIGRATNNVAEYHGLIAGLDGALNLGATEAAVFLDSKLLVEQMSGRWKVKHPDLIELHRRARELASRFDHISYTWIPRERNSYADRLANEAMDAAAGAGDPPGEAGESLPAPDPPQDPPESAAENPPESSRKTPPKPSPSTLGPDPAGPARAGRPPGCCCCATDRPNCPRSGATRAAAIRH